MERTSAQEAILIVNDVPDQLALAAAVLRQAGYRVVEARDGRTALRAARRERPALIISDVVMPYGDGIELCRAVRTDARLALTPILLLSAQRKDAASVVEGLAAGADDYLEAPYEPLRLVAQVARLLERARLEAHYRDLVEQTSDIIYTHDLAGQLTSINTAGALFTGHSREELLGRHVGEVFGLSEPAAWVEQVVRRLRAEGTQRVETQGRSGSGETRWLEFNQSLICDRTGAPTGVRGIARDITERWRVEAERRQMFRQQAEFEKMHSLGQLSAGVAHNFNNALAAILGRTQLLLRSITDEKQRRNLQIIETAALDAAEIVRRIQTFARRTLPARFQRVSLAQLVTDAIQLTRTRWEDDARAQGLHYDVQFSSDCAGADFIEANPSEVREVFVNLLLNALEAMPQGGRVECRERRAGDELIVEIADTGIGIEPELQARIFEPFYTTKGLHGSGLGLAVSYSIIQRHGGTISVTSAPGAGTTFTMRFSAHREDDEASDRTSAPLLPNCRVLVVDDDPQVREVLLDMLGALGQSVTTVSTAEEARRALAAAQFDLLITDLAMPGTDGLTLAAQAHAIAPAMPVALTTGYGRQHVTESSHSQLVQAIISKPFQLAEIEATLRKLLLGT